MAYVHATSHLLTTCCVKLAAKPVSGMAAPIDKSEWDKVAHYLKDGSISFSHNHVNHSAR